MSRMSGDAARTPSPRPQPSADGFDLDSVRRKPAYRTAVWLIRLAYLALVLDMFIFWSDDYDGLSYTSFVVGFTSITVGVFMLGKAGFPVGRQAASRVAGNPGINRRLLKDIFRLP